MNLPKAKEIIDHNIKLAGKKMPPDVKDALQIGSEAIDLIVEGRSKPGGMFFHDLPSETEQTTSPYYLAKGGHHA